MQKIIVEFLEDAGAYTIELACYDVSPEEHKEVRKYLESINAKFGLIDADVIRATLVIDDYDTAIKTLKELESNGWVFG